MWSGGQVTSSGEILATENVKMVIYTVPADWGWWPPSEGGFGAIMGVWLRPFSAGKVTLWSTLDSEGASLPASTCHMKDSTF